MKQDKKSKSQLTLIYTLTCLALIPIFVLNGYYIYQSRQKAVNEKVDKIKAITKSKQVTLENHLSNYIYFLETLANSNVLKSDIKNSNFNGEGSNLIRKLQESMWGAYHHVFIADTSGNIIISPHHGDNKKSTHAGHSIKESKFFNKSLKSTQVTDFFGFEETTHYHQLVMVPIKDGEKTLGVIISEITIQFYIDLLKKDFELGKTGEVYLSTLNKEKVVHLKKSEIVKLDSPLLNQALESGEAYGVNQDKLGSYLKSKKFPWILIVELDKSEFIGPIDANVKKISIIYVILIILFLFVFNHIVKLLKKPAQKYSEQLSQISEDTSKNSQVLNERSKELVEGAFQLAESLTENQGQLERVVQGIKDDEKLIEDALRESDRTSEVATKGQQTVQNMNMSMSKVVESNEKVQKEIASLMESIFEISDSIKLIQEKTNLINDIVFQTKLLSFNASVEAARAGEHGKGFAVVAEEVGNLADMSGNTSVEIHQMIEDSVKKVEHIVKTSKESLDVVMNQSHDSTSTSRDNVEDCRVLFNEISSNINQLHQKVENVSKSAAQNVIIIDEVNDRFLDLRKVSDSSSEIAEYVKKHMHQLKNDTQKLHLVSKGLRDKFSS